MRLQVSRPSYGKGSQVDTLGSQFIADLLACDEGPARSARAGAA
jgi:hypothetical protein